jgi:hypothetical protein
LPASVIVPPLSAELLVIFVTAVVVTDATYTGLSFLQFVNNIRRSRIDESRRICCITLVMDLLANSFNFNVINAQILSQFGDSFNGFDFQNSILHKEKSAMPENFQHANSMK